MQTSLFLDSSKNIIQQIDKNIDSKNPYAVDNYLWKNNIKFAGIDEVGRGPLFGPVTAACVVLKPNTYIEGLNDSKKLSAKKREALYSVIKENCEYCSVKYVDVITIDKINILEATKLAMKNSAIDLDKDTLLLIDGNQKVEQLDYLQKTIIKGDSKSASIAAASIIAKVERDNLMKEFAKEYPGYDLEHNMGYGTKKHCEALKKIGICKQHRKTFVKKIIFSS